MRDLVPFVQFKKREKHSLRSVAFTKSNTPPRIFFTFFKLYKCSSTSHNASRIYYSDPNALITVIISQWIQDLNWRCTLHLMEVSGTFSIRHISTLKSLFLTLNMPCFLDRRIVRNYYYFDILIYIPDQIYKTIPSQNLVPLKIVRLCNHHRR